MWTVGAAAHQVRQKFRQLSCSTCVRGEVRPFSALAHPNEYVSSSFMKTATAWRGPSPGDLGSSERRRADANILRLANCGLGRVRI